MPQGGVDQNENFIDAMKRIIRGNSIKNIEFLKHLMVVRILSSQKLVGIIWKGRFKGQNKMVLTRF